MRRLPAIAIVIGAVLLTRSAAADAHCGYLPPPPVALETESLQLTHVADVGQPTAVVSAPGEPGRLYVSERAGRVVAIEADGSRRVFLDIAAKIEPTIDWADGERGMQSVAFAPDYRTSRRLYVFYSDAAGDLRVDEFRSEPGFSAADRATRRTLLLLPHSFAENHFGGQLEFGPDGRLYIGIGDAVRAQWAQERGLYGRVVSLRPSRPRATLRVVAKGLRNPFRFSFAPSGRKLIVADVGELAQEEVNVLPQRRFGRANFGWPYREGNRRLRRGRLADYVAPALTYRRRGRGAAVIGGRVVRDPRLPGLRGRYLYADLCQGWIAAARLGGRHATTARTGLRAEYPTAFGEDAAGRIHVATASGARGGHVYRLDPRQPAERSGL
jgi:glucose/arabinose dehydrogenase